MNARITCDKEKEIPHFTAITISRVHIFFNCSETLSIHDELRQPALHSLREQLRKREDLEAWIQKQRRTKEQRDTKQRKLEYRPGQLQEKICQREKSQKERFTTFEEWLQKKEKAYVHEQLKEEEEQQKNLQRQLTEMKQQLIDCIGQIRKKDEELSNVQQPFSTLKRQLRVKEQEVDELELSLTAARQILSQQRRQETCDWVISRNEIQVTDKCLGRGGWGIVYEGTYCGCSVAVKQIHNVLLSDYNRRLFEREINMASRCRHPCLLLFIGATNDEGSPLFVSELMETNLLALLGQRGLSETEINVISLDVAQALNYLHQKKPIPIIHRDVSSSHVLLWRKGDQWRGKVSDYGSASFVRKTMTPNPGPIIYSAPEAFTSSQTHMISGFNLFQYALKY